MRITLLTLGSPEGKSVWAVAKFLRCFLGNPHVLRVPAIARWLLVNCVIVPFYSWSSAKRYRRVWCEQENCSLQISKTRALVKALRERLPNCEVDFETLAGTQIHQNLKTKNSPHSTLHSPLFIPLFPHFAESSFGALAGTRKNVIAPFGSHPAFIEALVKHFKKHVPAPRVVVLSFHSVPASVPEASRYERDCYETATLFAIAAGLPQTAVRVGFQSKFGPKKWLVPATKSLVASAPAGTVLLPAGFICDCIETVVELGDLVAGTPVKLLPCLNENAAEMLAKITA